jgi:hypothetical protein
MQYNKTDRTITPADLKPVTTVMTPIGLVTYRCKVKLSDKPNFLDRAITDDWQPYDAADVVHKPTPLAKRIVEEGNLQALQALIAGEVVYIFADYSGIEHYFLEEDFTNNAIQRAPKTIILNRTTPNIHANGIKVQPVQTLNGCLKKLEETPEAVELFKECCEAARLKARYKLKGSARLYSAQDLLELA